jgi:hypothetical protein
MLHPDRIPRLRVSQSTKYIRRNFILCSFSPFLDVDSAFFTTKNKKIKRAVLVHIFFETDVPFEHLDPIPDNCVRIQIHSLC